MCYRTRWSAVTGSSKNADSIKRSPPRPILMVGTPFRPFCHSEGLSSFWCLLLFGEPWFYTVHTIWCLLVCWWCFVKIWLQVYKGAPGRLRTPIKASWAKLSFDLRPNIGIRSHNEKILGWNRIMNEETLVNQGSDGSISTDKWVIRRPPYVHHSHPC